VARITEVLQRQVDVAEEACSSGSVDGATLTALNMSVVHLRGHLASKNMATPEQLARLENVHRRITQLRRGAGAGPGGPGPLDAASVRPVLGELRDILATLDTGQTSP
jgi:hypothetical protein